jgi:hypothetical protein
VILHAEVQIRPGLQVNTEEGQNPKEVNKFIFDLSVLDLKNKDEVNEFITSYDDKKGSTITPV